MRVQRPGESKAWREGAWGRKAFDHPWLQRVYEFLTREIWVPELAGLPRLRAFVYKALRVVFLTGRGFLNDRCLFRASALTYVTILSLVPTLAIVFAIFGALGVFDDLEAQLEPMLQQYLGAPTPAGAEESEVNALRDGADQLLDFVVGTDLSGVGWVGLFILLFTVVKLLGAIEASFNDIFGVQRARSWVRKVTDYFAIVIFTPVLVIMATAMATLQAGPTITAFVEESLGLGAVAQFALQWTPIAVLWLVFTFVYMTMPNARTRIGSAALGGLVAGVVWYLVLLAHVRFQVGVARYNAIYASFATVPIFMVWVHVSWSVVLLGAELAAAHQSEPSFRHVARQRPLDESLREVVALRAAARIARAFLAGEPPRNGLDLATEIGVSPRSMESVLHALVEAHVLVETDHDGLEPGLVLALDPGRVRVSDVVAALRGGSRPEDLPSEDALDRELDRDLVALRDAARASPRNRTLRELGEAELGGEPERAPDAP